MQTTVPNTSHPCLLGVNLGLFGLEGCKQPVLFLPEVVAALLEVNF